MRSTTVGIQIGPHGCVKISSLVHASPCWSRRMGRLPSFQDRQWLRTVSLPRAEKRPDLEPVPCGWFLYYSTGPPQKKAGGRINSVIARRVRDVWVGSEKQAARVLVRG